MPRWVRTAKQVATTPSNTKHRTRSYSNIVEGEASVSQERTPTAGVLGSCATSARSDSCVGNERSQNSLAVWTKKLRSCRRAKRGGNLRRYQQEALDLCKKVADFCARRARQIENDSDFASQIQFMSSQSVVKPRNCEKANRLHLN